MNVKSLRGRREDRIGCENVEFSFGECVWVWMRLILIILQYFDFDPYVTFKISNDHPTLSKWYHCHHHISSQITLSSYKQL